jgi:hypothetical protein
MFFLVALTKCHFAIMNFDMWMLKRAYDVFELIIRILSNDW